MDKEQLIEFYKNNKPILPSDISWRVIKLQYGDVCINLKRQIHSAEQLQKILIANPPDNIWFSCARWLNPVKVRGKTRQSGFMNVLLGCDVFIDIDDNDYAQVLRVLDFFSRPEYRDVYELTDVIKSGGGYHIIYQEKKSTIGTIHPEKRIEWLAGRRRALEFALIKSGVKFDVGPKDIMRVRRIPNTWNNNRDSLCHILDGGDITSNDPISKEVSTSCQEKRGGQKSPLTCSSPKKDDMVMAPVTPGLTTLQSTEKSIETSERTDRKLFDDRESFPSEYRKKGRTEVSPSFYKFISNSVNGTHGQLVPYVEIEKNRDYSKVVKIMNRYNLGNIYVFETEERIALLSLKLCSPRRVEKILKACRSMNLNQQLKYHNVWVKTSGVLNRAKLTKLKLIDVIEGEMCGAISKPHYEFIKSLSLSGTGQMGDKPAWADRTTMCDPASDTNQTRTMSQCSNGVSHTPLNGTYEFFGLTSKSGERSTDALLVFAGHTNKIYTCINRGR